MKEPNGKKILLLAHSWFSGTAQQYFQGLIPCYEPPQSLQSSSQFCLSIPSPSPNCAGHWGTTEDLTSYSLHLGVLHCPLEHGKLKTCPFSYVVFPPLFLSALSSSSLSLYLARWFWPDLMNGRHGHTTSVCISLRWSGLHVIWLPAQSWLNLFVGDMVFLYEMPSTLQ